MVRKSIVLVVYALDREDKVFSHQLEIAAFLATKFERVVILAGRVGQYNLPGNVEIINYQWISGQKFRNIVKFLFTYLNAIFRNLDAIIFFHMTDIQAMIGAPISFIFRQKIYLWYAHASLSFALRISSFFVKNIVTSTYGSCPIQSKKTKNIGQSIDEVKFKYFERDSWERLIHYSRFDESKNLHKLVDAALILRNYNPKITLTLIGDPSSKQSFQYKSNFELKYKEHLDEGWLLIQRGLNRDSLPEILLQYDVFLHAFQGSLDKTTIEATLSGLPVITVNREYLNEFGSWQNRKISSGKDSIKFLVLEYINFLSLSTEQKKLQLNLRRNLAINSHSKTHWESTIMEVLTK